MCVCVCMCACMHVLVHDIFIVKCVFQQLELVLVVIFQFVHRYQHNVFEVYTKCA